MKHILILLILSLTLNSQNIDLNIPIYKQEKKEELLKIVGIAITTIGFILPERSIAQRNRNIAICMSGMAIAMKPLIKIKINKKCK
jgi:uncharacterized membrane protein